MSQNEAKAEVAKQDPEGEDATPPELDLQWSFVPRSDAPLVSSSSLCLVLLAAGLKFL